MKNLRIAIVFLSMILSSCGGSEEALTSGSSTNAFQEKLSNTSWVKECSTYNKFQSDELKDAWNVKIKLSIDSALNATYRTEYFHPNDTGCKSVMFDFFEVSKLSIRGRIMSEESIDANGLDEIFTYSSGNREITPSYTLIYVDGEKLYFGQISASKSGKTLETRHSSISLDNYFRKLIN